jgi:membrane fusion protein, multidrug efflux system
MARWLGPALVFSTALACGSGHEGSGAPAPPTATAVRVTTVAEADATRTLAASGTLVAERSVVLRPETSGLVTSVGFDHGASVLAGQVLARLVDAEPRAALAEAEARVALAEADFDRTEKLASRENTSRADLDRARASKALAAAERDRARDAVRKTVVRAPFAGTVGLRRIVVGDLVDPSREITTLVDPTALGVDVAIPERELSHLSLGGAAKIEVDALPGQPITGHVSFVSPEVALDTRTVLVRVAIDDPTGLRPGLTARVTLEGATLPAVRVPTQAVLTTARGSAVYVVGADQKAELRSVVTADRELDTLRIVEGLQPGDQVVVDGLVRLRPGASVRVLAP